MFSVCVDDVELYHIRLEAHEFAHSDHPPRTPIALHWYVIPEIRELIARDLQLAQLVRLPDLDLAVGRDKHVLEALNLTQFRLPQSDILSRPALIVVDKAVRDVEQASEVGWDLKTDDVWQVVSSA